MILFLNFHFNILLFAYRNTIDFCILTLHFVTLINSLLVGYFLYISRDFLYSKSCYPSIETVLFLLFQPECLLFHFLALGHCPGLLVQYWKGGWVGILTLLPVLGKKKSVFWPLSLMLVVGFYVVSLHQVKEAPFYS